MNNIHCSADYIAHLLRQGLDEEELQKKLRAYNEAVQQQREQWELQHKDNPRLFLNTKGLYAYDPFGSISSQELYAIYQDWCLREKLPLFSPREFWSRVKELAPSYCLRYSGQVLDSQGKRVRGFRGIRALLPEEEENT